MVRNNENLGGALTNSNSPGRLGLTYEEEKHYNDPSCHQAK